MNTRSSTTRQATAFGLALAVTLSMLASVDRLATEPATELQIARQALPTQVVVIETRRDART